MCDFSVGVWQTAEKVACLWHDVLYACAGLMCFFLGDTARSVEEALVCWVLVLEVVWRRY